MRIFLSVALLSCLCWGCSKEPVTKLPAVVEIEDQKPMNNLPPRKGVDYFQQTSDGFVVTVLPPQRTYVSDELIPAKEGVLFNPDFRLMIPVSVVNYGGDVSFMSQDEKYFKLYTSKGTPGTLWPITKYEKRDRKDSWFCTLTFNYINLQFHDAAMSQSLKFVVTLPKMSRPLTFDIPRSWMKGDNQTFPD